MRNVNCEIFYGLSVLSVKTKKYILAKEQYSMWKYMGCLYCRWKLRLISWKQCFQQLFPWEHVCLLAFCNLHLYFYIILYLSTSWQYCFNSFSPREQVAVFLSSFSLSSCLLVDFAQLPIVHCALLSHCCLSQTLMTMRTRMMMMRMRTMRMVMMPCRLFAIN